MATALWGRGTTCGRRAFIRSFGMVQVAASRSNSAQGAARNSPGRTAVSTNRRMAQRVRALMLVVSILPSNSGSSAKLTCGWWRAAFAGAATTSRSVAGLFSTTPLASA
ncbi:hypothetical protein D9M70_549240 [compost metagenome]